jgi:hypothetical protein
MKGRTAKVFAGAVILIGAGFTCSHPFAFLKRNQSKITADSIVMSSTLSGVIHRADECGSEPMDIVFQNQIQGTNVRVETHTDLAGRFQVQMPAGVYRMNARSKDCVFEQTLTLEASTEQLYSFDMRPSQDSDQSLDDAMVGGRLPASLLKNSEPSK